MTKMPLAINRWSELSYYLETQRWGLAARQMRVSFMMTVESQSEKAMKERRDDV